MVTPNMTMGSIIEWVPFLNTSILDEVNISDYLDRDNFKVREISSEFSDNLNSVDCNHNKTSLMKCFQRIKDLLGDNILFQDILKSACDTLETDIRFENVRETLVDSLSQLIEDRNSKTTLVFLGQQGLCKTVVAYKFLTDYFYSIGRTQRQSFLKIEPYKLDKTDFENEIKSKLIEGKGGLIFIDEVHNLREVEAIFFQQLISTLSQEGFQRTGFIISAGAPSWKKLKEKFQDLSLLFPIQVYFEPYTDEQLAGILKQAMHEDGDPLQIPTNYHIENLIRELRTIRSRQGQYFENASEIMFYYHQCLKRAAIYLQSDTLTQDLERLSLKNFSKTIVRR